MNKSNQKPENHNTNAISNRRETDTPSFIKLSMIVFSACCLSYLITYVSGVINHTGSNAMMEQTANSSNPAVFIIPIIGMIFSIAVVVFAVRRFNQE